MNAWCASSASQIETKQNRRILVMSCVSLYLHQSVQTTTAMTATTTATMSVLHILMLWQSNAGRDVRHCTLEWETNKIIIACCANKIHDYCQSERNGNGMIERNVVAFILWRACRTPRYKSVRNRNCIETLLCHIWTVRYSFDNSVWNGPKRRRQQQCKLSNIIYRWQVENVCGNKSCHNCKHTHAYTSVRIRIRIQNSTHITANAITINITDRLA